MRPTTILALSCLLGAQPTQSQPAVTGGVSGHVFLDRNGNGLRDAGEPGVGGVAVSNQDQVVLTGADGAYALPGPGNAGIVFVSVPGGYSAGGRFYRTIDSSASSRGPHDFALTRAPARTSLTFVHASDTHIAEASLRAYDGACGSWWIRSGRTSCIISGDLVRDALRVGEAEATGYYELFQREIARFAPPVYTVPGNHEIFGIERDKSGVSAGHRLYGRVMYRHFAAPTTTRSMPAACTSWASTRSTSTTRATTATSTARNWRGWSATGGPPEGDAGGDVQPHPVLLGAGERERLCGGAAGAERDHRGRQGAVPPHGVECGRRARAHQGPSVSARAGGHIHMRERIRYEGVPTRFEQAAAVVGPSAGLGGALPSGITVYRITSGRIDEGRSCRWESASDRLEQGGETARSEQQKARGSSGRASGWRPPP